MSGKREHLPVESGTVRSSSHVYNAVKTSNWKHVRFSKATDKSRTQRDLLTCLSRLHSSPAAQDTSIAVSNFLFLNVLSLVATVRFSCHRKCAKRMGRIVVDMPALPQICLRSIKLLRESRKYASRVRVPDNGRIY
jgi:hypothetical protein